MYYWYTDAQYLGRERAFRRLYDQVRKAELDDDSYVMDIGGLYGQSPVWHCMRVSSVADERDPGDGLGGSSLRGFKTLLHE